MLASLGRRQLDRDMGKKDSPFVRPRLVQFVVLLVLLYCLSFMHSLGLRHPMHR